MSDNGATTVKHDKYLKLKVVFVIASCCFIAFAAFNLYNFFKGFSEFEDRAFSTIGMDRAEAIKVMGEEPTRSLTGAEYTANPDTVAGGYSPNPPDVEADYVLRFGYANSMALLFFIDGTVKEVYVGAT